jgi:hypothetical protein
LIGPVFELLANLPSFSSGLFLGDGLYLLMGSMRWTVSWFAMSCLFQWMAQREPEPFLY